MMRRSRVDLGRKHETGERYSLEGLDAQRPSTEALLPALRDIPSGPGLSQISGVDGSSGMAAKFSLGCRGAAPDPKSDFRAAEAPIPRRTPRAAPPSHADPAGCHPVSALSAQ